MSMEVHKIIEDFQKLREDFEVRKEQDIASNVTYVARRPAKGSTPLDNEFTSREGFQLSSIADEVEEVKHEQENKFQRKTRDLVELQVYRQSTALIDTLCPQLFNYYRELSRGAQFGGCRYKKRLTTLPWTSVRQKSLFQKQS